MRLKIYKGFCAMIGLGLLLIFTGDTAYGQCGTLGHKPCAKSYKRKAKKRVVRAKKVVRRKKVVHAARKKVPVTPHRVERYTVIGSPDTVYAPAENAPPADYQGPVTTSPNVPKQISGGVLNGKANSLPKPAYPPAARAVRASGAVSVQVLIDENGDVISASAVSGHPLLKSAAVQAARRAKFSPTRLMGQPVKVSGIIIYNFIP